MSERYRNVNELIESIDMSAKQKQALKGFVDERSLSRSLTILRAKSGLNQKEVAERCGCTQSRISKLECKEDHKITVGELRDYLDSLGFDLQVVAQQKTRVDGEGFYLGSRQETSVSI